MLYFISNKMPRDLNEINACLKRDNQKRKLVARITSAETKCRSAVGMAALIVA